MLRQGGVVIKLDRTDLVYFVKKDFRLLAWSGLAFNIDLCESVDHLSGKGT